VTTSRAERITALGRALLGAITLLAIAPSLEGAPNLALAVSLVPMWLLFASLIGYAGSLSAQRQRGEGRLFIPLRFSGSTGRFRLRRRGDGRHVQILEADTVVAELRATDMRDEIHFHGAVAPEDSRDFGSAVGQAIELVSVADEAHLDWDDHGLEHRAGVDKRARVSW
jgi:hypothetical protein